jgi:glycosyltransferase involved in cell wall biosynthesis
MLVSVVTPTHNSQWLMSAYRSLVAQDHTNWEWVILTNGEGFRSQLMTIPEEIRKDARVVVRAATVVADNGKVGALKREAFDLASGEILVELDHDDWLSPDCLSKLVKARVEHNAGFMYSDFVVISEETDECVVYDASYGWRNYPWFHEGKLRTAMASFEVDPRTLTSIQLAPNHVRAWAAETYRQVGGHDPRLSVADDMDLVLRTYLSGAVFVRIPSPLYLYRERADGRNTYRDRSDEIVAMGAEIATRYFYPTVVEWCRRGKHRAVHLIPEFGQVGWEPYGGFTPSAVRPPTTSTGFTLLPFEDNSLGALQVYDWLHRVGPDQMIPVMNEFYRVLKPGGWLLTNTPAATGQGIGDPRTRSLWNALTFGYFTDSDYAKQLGNQVQCRFQAIRVGEYFPTEWQEALNLVYVFADLVAIKDGYQLAGELKI